MCVANYWTVKLNLRTLSFKKQLEFEYIEKEESNENCNKR